MSNLVYSPQSEELRGAFCILLFRILRFRFLFDSIHKDSSFQELGDQGVSLDPSEPLFRGKSHLKDQGQKSLSGKASSNLLCPVPDRRKGRFDRIGRPDRHPMTGREVIEGQKNLLLLLQTLHRLRILILIGFHKALKHLLRLFPVLGVPELPDLGLGPGLERLGKVVQDVQGFMDPATLFPDCRKDLPDRRPEPSAPSPIARRGSFSPRSLRSRRTSFQLSGDSLNPSLIARIFFSPRLFTPITTRRQSLSDSFRIFE